MDYKFVINDFEGPLDLLLHLVKTSEMDIYDISVEKITEQYLEFIRRMEEMNLTVASEYLVMAAELIELKSRLLLPNSKNDEDDEYEEDPRENLINRLVEYKKYKDMVDTFKTLEDDRRNIYTKEPINLGEFTDYEITNDGSVTVEDLTKALSDFLKRKEDEKPLETKITKKEISVTDRTKDIRNILRDKKKVSFFDLFEVKTREYVVVTFLSILEMAKFGEINIIQENNFVNIVAIPRTSNTSPIIRFSFLISHLFANLAATTALNKHVATTTLIGRAFIPAPIVIWLIAPTRATKVIISVLVPTATFKL